MRTLPLLSSVVCLLCLLGGLPAQAPVTSQDPKPEAQPDRLILRNGDPVTGTLKSMVGGKVIFVSPILGKLTIKMEDIKEIITAKPVIVVTKAGETQTKAITGAEDLADITAINPKEKKPVVWSGSVSIGGSWESGNTDKRRIGSQVDFERRTEKGRLTGTGRVLYEEEKTTGDWSLTDRIYRGRLQQDWFINKQSYLLWFTAAERDSLADLDLRFATGPGYGYQFVETEELKFSTEIGPSYVREDLKNPSDTEEWVATRLRANVAWQINPSVRFLYDIHYFQSLEDKRDSNVFIDSRLRVSLTEEMFTQLQYIFEFDNTPGMNAERVDNTVLLSVGFTF